MHLSRIGVVAAALTSISQAFLIPPEISIAEADIIEKFTSGGLLPPDRKAVYIDCPECPVETGLEGGEPHAVRAETMLELNFTIQHRKTDQLLLNDIPIYPVDPNSLALMESLNVPQIIRDKTDNRESMSTIRLGISTSVLNFMQTSDEEAVDLVSIKIDVFKVFGQVLSSIAAVELDLLQLQNGKLVIRKTEIRPAQATILSPTYSEQCQSILCKWRTVVAQVLAKAKGTVQPCDHKSDSATQPHHDIDRPHPLPMSHPHVHLSPAAIFQKYPHSYGNGNLQGLVYQLLFLIPIGIMISISASLLGIFVGHIAICLWTTFFRRNLDNSDGLNEAEIAHINSFAVENVDQPKGPPPMYITKIDEKSTLDLS